MEFWDTSQPALLSRTEAERLLRKMLSASVLPSAHDFRREFASEVEAVGDGVATLSGPSGTSACRRHGRTHRQPSMNPGRSFSCETTRFNSSPHWRKSYPPQTRHEKRVLRMRHPVVARSCQQAAGPPGGRNFTMGPLPQGWFPTGDSRFPFPYRLAQCRPDIQPPATRSPDRETVRTLWVLQ